MTIQIFSNNAKTTLAGAITSTQTTITVATGKGALFPNPTSGQQFKVTLVNATDPNIFEICNCTARSGDSLTVVRAQEGTTGKPFLTNDVVGHFDTAAVMTDLVQSDQLQNGYYLTAVATGSANALTATIPSNLTSIPNGMSIVVISSYANTGATTLNLTLGSTSTGAIPIVTSNATPLTAGLIPSAGYPITLSYSSTFGAWVITDGLIDLSLYAPKASPTFTGVPQAPTYSPPSPTAPSPTTQLATLGYVYNSLQNYAPIYSPGLTGVPTAPTAAVGTNTNQIATTNFAMEAGIGGSGQTWQNLTGSRAFNTYYYNSTNKPILVCITGDGYVGIDNYAYIYVNSVLIIVTGIGGGTNSTFTFIVPAYSNYIWLDQGGYVSLSCWSELRY